MRGVINICLKSARSPVLVGTSSRTKPPHHVATFGVRSRQEHVTFPRVRRWSRIRKQKVNAAIPVFTCLGQIQIGALFIARSEEAEAPLVQFSEYFDPKK